MYLKHILAEYFLVILAILFMNDLAELRKVDVAVPHNVIGQIYNFLLHGIQSQHFHGCMEILKY